MVVTNSLVLAIIGLTITSQQKLWVFTLLLPLVGLALCGIWFVLIRREAEYGIYYVLSARELEEKYLSDQVRTVSRGGLFAEGSNVTIEIGGKPVQLRMSRLARLLRARNAASWVIVLLATLYVAAILQGLF